MSQKIKRILSSLLVVVMIVGSAPLSGFASLDLPNLADLFTIKADAATESGKCGDNLTWSLDTDTGVLTISGTGAMYNWIDYEYVPWTSNRSSVKTVVIGDSVTSIGDAAFLYCAGLTSVTIPDSVTSIGYRAFEGCHSITSVTIGNSVTSIGDDAFYNCTGLTSITVKEGNLDYSSDEYGVLFNKDKTLLIQYPIGNTRTSYTIPDSVTRIGEGAFAYCTGLTSITIPDSVTSIGKYAFACCTCLTSVTIPDSVTSIGEDAFSSCTGLTSVTIPDSVTSIDNYAFYNCKGLTSVTIPDSVTSIGDSAFAHCTGLNSITVKEGNPKYSSDEYGVLFNKDKTLLIQYPIGNTRTSYTIPNSVTSIDGGAFYKCTSLTSVTIPDGVTSIGYCAFKDCDSLTSVTIPDSVTSIAGEAFEDCTGLTSVTIGNGVTSIGGGAFWGCTKLPSITIPNSVTSIGDSAFYDCTGLTSITIPDSVTSIGWGAFYNCTGLTSVTIPDSVTSIDNYAFYKCKGLTSVTIPDSVTSIGEHAFEYCTGLTSVTIGNNVTSIGDSAFAHCTGLTDVYYTGTEEEWNNINGHDEIKATIHFNGSGGSGEVSKRNYNIYAFSSKPQLILGTADYIEMRFEIDCYDFKNPAYLLPNPTFSFTTSDTNIFKIESIKNNDGNTSIGITGENPGTAILTVTGYNNGEYVAVGHFLITVTGESVYHADAMPKFDDYNIIANNIIIDKFKCENTGTETCNISFEAYNQMNCFGSVEVYDKDNNLLESHCLNRFGLGLPTGLWDMTKKAFDVTCFKDRSYKDEDCSTKTEVDLIAVPRDGHVVISNDPQSSIVCAIYNMSYLLADIGCQAVTMALHDSSADEACNNIAVAIAKETRDILLSNSSLLGQFKNFTKSFFTGADYGNREKIEKSVEFYSIFVSEIGVDVGEIAIEILKQSLKSVPVALIEKAIYSVFGPVGKIIKTGFSFISLADTADMIETLSDNCGVGNVSIYCSLPWNEELFSNGYMVRGQESFEGKTSFHQYKIVDKKTYDEVTDTFGTEKYIDVVEMSLYQNGEKVQPNGTVEVAVPLPQGIIFMNVRIYRKEEDGTYTKMKCKVENGYIYFNTEHFSVYCIVADCDQLEGLNFENDYISLNVDQAFTQLPMYYPENSIGTELVWSSSDENVAVVTPMGNVVGLNPGIAEIYVSTVNGDIQTSYTVEVTDNISVYLNENNVEMKYKDSIMLNPVIDVNEGVNYTVTYTSSNPSVARVDENGKVYGAKKGSTEITVTVTDEYGNTVSDTCKVNVTYAWWQWIIVIVLFGWIWY